MGWTTGRTTAQMITVLVAAGALTDQAASALASIAHKKNAPVCVWGTLVQCTAGWNDGDPVFEYDSTPVVTANRTFAQAVTDLTGAGATTDQAIQALHSLAWTPNVYKTVWGVVVKCTSGWNSTTAPVYSTATAPS